MSNKEINTRHFIFSGNNCKSKFGTFFNLSTNRFKSKHGTFFFNLFASKCKSIFGLYFENFSSKFGTFFPQILCQLLKRIVSRFGACATIQRRVHNLCVLCGIKPQDRRINSMSNTKFNIFCLNPLKYSVKFGHQSFSQPSCSRMATRRLSFCLRKITVCDY